MPTSSAATTTPTTTSTLFIESTPTSFEVLKELVFAIVALSDGTFVSCGSSDYTVKRWLISTTTTTTTTSTTNDNNTKYDGS